MTSTDSRMAVALLRQMACASEQLPRIVAEFVDLVSEGELEDSDTTNILIEFVHDLAYYQPDPRIRRKQGGLLDEEMVAYEARQALAKLDDGNPRG